MLTDAAFNVSRFRPVSTIQISARCTLSSKGAWGEAQHGHNHRGLSLVDVARPLLPSTLPLYRIPVPVVQRIRACQSRLSSGSNVARACSQYHVFRTFPRKYHHYCDGCAAKTQGENGHQPAATVPPRPKNRLALPSRTMLYFITFIFQLNIAAAGPLTK